MEAFRPLQLVILKMSPQRPPVQTQEETVFLFYITALQKVAAKEGSKR